MPHPHAQAKTGTGKTLAFALPIIEKLTRDDKAKSKHPERSRVKIAALH